MTNNAKQELPMTGRLCQRPINTGRQILIPRHGRKFWPVSDVGHIFRSQRQAEQPASAQIVWIVVILLLHVWAGSSVPAGGAEPGNRAMKGDMPIAIPARGDFNNDPSKEVRQQDSAVALHYKVAKSSEVSAAVYDSKGILVRTLLCAKPHVPGEYTLYWDGLDRIGRPQPVGTYKVKFLMKPPFRREFIMQIGVNHEDQPLDLWVGNYLGGTSVAVDSSGIYIGSGHTEAGLILIKLSLDGKKRLWAAENVHPHQGPISLETDGETVYALQWNAFIALFDAKTGKHIGLWDVLPKSKRNKGIEKKRERLLYTQYKFVLPQIDLAVSGKTRVLTDERENTVQWLGDKGEVVAEAAVPAPRGAAIGPDGTVYVISGTEVKSVTKGGETKTIIRGLTNPFRLAYEPAQGDLLVADGPDDWRVKRYSLAGELKRAYGRKGGRQDGPYEPRDFREFKDLTADGRGGFYVGEPRYAPRRIVHLDAEGQVVREWFGGLPFFVPRSIDPRDPTKLWYSADGLVLAEIDYEKRAWRVLETHRVEGKAAGLARNLSSTSMFQVRYHDGKRYLVGESFPPMVFRHENGRLDPLVIGNRDRSFPQAEEIARIMTATDDEVKIEAWITQYLKNANGQLYGKRNAYLWTDANGDHHPQKEEIELPDKELGSVYHGPGMGVSIGSDFSILFGSGDYNPHRGEPGQPVFYSSIGRLAPTGWKDGIPQYRLPQRAADMDVAPLYVETGHIRTRQGASHVPGRCGRTLCTLLLGRQRAGQLSERSGAAPRPARQMGRQGSAAVVGGPQGS